MFIFLTPFSAHVSCRRTNDPGPPSNFRAGTKVSDLKCHEITAPELAVDREVKQSAVPNALLSIQEKSHGPNLLLV